MLKYPLSSQRVLVILSHWSLALFLLVTLTACAGGIGGSASVAWREEVLLHDGKKIIVERSQTYGGRHEVGQSPPVKELTIAFKQPGSGQRITWTSEYAEDLGRTNFDIAALHVLNDTPYLVALPNLCLSYNKWGRPNPPYVFFKYEGNVWKRIALEELPTEFKDTNMVINNLGEAEALKSQSLVSAERVKELNAKLRQPEYKTILLKTFPQEQMTTMCAEMIHYKCGWISPIGDFGRKFMDSTCK